MDKAYGLYPYDRGSTPLEDANMPKMPKFNPSERQEAFTDEVQNFRLQTGDGALIFRDMGVGMVIPGLAMETKIFPPYLHMCFMIYQGITNPKYQDKFNELIEFISNDMGVKEVEHSGVH